MAFGTPNVGKDKYTGYSYIPEGETEPKPIVVTKQRGRPVKEARHNPSWLPEEHRIEIATLWAATRNWKTVSELTGYTVGKLKKMKDEPWFQSIVARVIKDKNDELDASITDVIHRCGELLVDRLEKGNHLYNFKTRELVRVPLQSRDLVMALGILFDKRQLLRGEATSRTESTTSAQRLEGLRKEFLQFHEAIEIEGEIIEPVQQEESQDAGQGRQETLPEVRTDETNG